MSLSARHDLDAEYGPRGQEGRGFRTSTNLRLIERPLGLVDETVTVTGTLAPGCSRLSPSGVRSSEMLPR